MNTQSQTAHWLRGAQTRLTRPYNQLRINLASVTLDPLRAVQHAWRAQRWPATWLQSR